MQLEHLGFPFGERANSLRSSASRRAERSQQLGGRVGVPGGLESLEALERQLRLGDGDLG